MSDIRVGDELVLVPSSRYRNRERVTVARIGRKYLYVAFAEARGGEHRSRFHIDTLTEDTQYGSPDRLYTVEQLAEEDERQRLFGELGELGVEFSYRINRKKWTSEQLKRILEVAES